MITRLIPYILIFAGSSILLEESVAIWAGVMLVHVGVLHTLTKKSSKNK